MGISIVKLKRLISATTAARKMAFRDGSMFRTTMANHLGIHPATLYRWVDGAREVGVIIDTKRVPWRITNRGGWK